MKHVTIDGNQMEAGAGIAIKANKYIWQLADEMNLTKLTRDFSKHDDNNDLEGKFGVWDPINQRFQLFEYYNYSFLNVLYILYHYGPFTFRNTMNTAKQFINDTQNIYNAQDNGIYFKNSESFWNTMDSYLPTQTDGATYLYKQLS